jgi:hypothetical protein
MQVTILHRKSQTLVRNDNFRTNIGKVSSHRRPNIFVHHSYALLINFFDGQVRVDSGLFFFFDSSKQSICNYIEVPDALFVDFTAITAKNEKGSSR